MARRIVKSLNNALAVGKNGRFIFAQIVRRQAALAFADAHRPARAMKANPDIGSGSHRVIQLRAVRIEIEMIRGRCAAAQRQFGKAKHCRPVDMFRSQM